LHFLIGFAIGFLTQFHQRGIAIRQLALQCGKGAL